MRNLSVLFAILEKDLAFDLNADLERAAFSATVLQPQFTRNSGGTIQ
jgi:hypothetical protein